jgi:hypothetical protein
VSCFAATLVACGGESRPGAPDELPTGLTVAATDDGSGSANDSESEDETSGETRLDVGDGASVDRDGCRYVDILFVVDNSGSMCDAQEGLAGALPGLIDAIYESLPSSTDLHVGIVTTSFSEGGSHQERNCQAQEGPVTIESHYVTGSYVSGNGYQGRLFEYDGQRFFEANTGDSASKEPLKQWFTEAATAVGCNGGAYEFPAAAAAYALHPSNAEYNAGFVRDAEAALAIFVLTNEIDQSLEPMDFYRDTILDAKAECGGADCITTAGLLSPTCVPDANPVVWQFLSAFGSEPTWGDIEDYAGYPAIVSSALADAITDTCEEIEPIG